MNAPRNRSPLWSVATLVVAICGCGDAPVDVAVATTKPNPFQLAAANAKALSEATDKAAEPTPVVAEPTAEEVAYEPPCPDRLDLFAPPKKGARVTQQTTGDSTESVVLLGFANLGVPRAVLAINNQIAPIRAGDEAGGVRVISISPPQAVLQRGRSRWTASLE